jgi:hypothetical protein
MIIVLPARRSAPLALMEAVAALAMRRAVADVAALVL